MKLCERIFLIIFLFLLPLCWALDIFINGWKCHCSIRQWLHVWVVSWRGPKGCGC